MADVSPTGSTTPRDVVELRVHGVSGAGADQVLDRPHVHQVAGDRSGGFYRPRPGYPDSTGTDGVTLEAYRWGDLPSGTAGRTLSLVFLLPFMLCNVALWMVPAKPASMRGFMAVCRVLALTLTMLYVLSIVGVALDLIAWRCMSTPSCLAGRSWLSWLGGARSGCASGSCRWCRSPPSGSSGGWAPAPATRSTRSGPRRRRSRSTG
ncbi:hypothetical protein [Micromonospora tarensis]|uniref:hypothetical protein n=1 Tax=Micromonospora tarensis TaxID=2806100 RepID=UPI001EE3DF09|nr:hypothetical protein [Micromonospora tarensis]